MLAKGAEEDRLLLELVKDYEDMFIKVGQWQTWKRFDIDLNNIHDETDENPAPDFVTNFERMLDRKPGLRPEVGCSLDSQSRAAYFELREDSTIEDESLRYAGQLEALHITHIVSYAWHNLWHGHNKKALKGCLANALFFFQVSCVPMNRTTSVKRYVLTRIL